MLLTISPACLYTFKGTFKLLGKTGNGYTVSFILQHLGLLVGGMVGVF